jgi:hypothetical protein
MAHCREAFLICPPRPERRTKMKKHLLMLATSAAILACVPVAGSAQQTGRPEAQRAQSPTVGQAPVPQTPVVPETLPGTPGGTAQQPAQQPSQQPSQQQTTQDRMHERMRERMQELMQERAQRDEDEAGDHEGWHRHHRDMMDWRQRQGAAHGPFSGPLGRLLFALIDSDGDGTISLQEWQAAHERIFKAMDTDKDGTLTFEEIQQFIQGGGRPPRPDGR